MTNLGVAAQQIFGPGGPGFIVTLILVFSIGEFVAEQFLRATNPIRVVILKAGGHVGTVLIFLIYVGMLLLKYAKFTETGTF